MAGWLKLQNEVNALIDSTAAENTDQSVSALEGKTGWVGGGPTDA